MNARIATRNLRSRLVFDRLWRFRVTDYAAADGFCFIRTGHSRLAGRFYYFD